VAIFCYASSVDLTPQQISILERLHSLGFEIVAFPMYANYIGVRQSNLAALLAPTPSAGFTLFAEPTILINGNFSVRVTRSGRDLFVWKSQHVEATPSLLSALANFRSQLVSTSITNGSL
jgi:hypothetical protein